MGGGEQNKEQRESRIKGVGREAEGSVIQCNSSSTLQQTDQIHILIRHDTFLSDDGSQWSN